MTHIREVAVEIRRDKEAKALARQAVEEKGVPDLLGSNLTYLLLLRQVAAHEDLSTMWKELLGSPKCQHMMTLQKAFDNTAQRLSIRAPIGVPTGMLNLNLALGLRLEHRNDLGSGLHQLGLGQHTSAT